LSWQCKQIHTRQHNNWNVLFFYPTPTQKESATLLHTHWTWLEIISERYDEYLFIYIM